ncbi:mechanosensitive ion channel family protein [Candidatus Desulforudis audaxviator]|uniref:MscS Mechanosensitive ion channel n=1 Tax=Desulforudis audaxviator (strain MP104C) TaxID=477974 RepID=B1I222_DESAP|nr:mechanosensitive ion channel family protein [Candidatus Desulforudis audaxviator]ACA58981.1 MscS Mechanosensitive ion channel [Candidatus Desulforudis audaxviator MP104C]AZK59020.1 Small-conductance mechanosensitive channel [Candidatus Desulforudis audaxviator]
MDGMTFFEQLNASVQTYLLDVAFWLRAAEVTARVLVIIVAAHLIVRLARKAIQKLLKQRDKGLVKVDERRLGTVSALLGNVVGYVVYFVMVLMILAQLGFNLGPVLAGAGIIGLAVGFGAQNLVRDVISGLFIILEDQYAVGDYVSIGNFTGTVQEVGLRVTRIKQWTGEVHFIPNGTITQVTNFSKENSAAVVDVGVAYGEKIDEVTRVLEALLARLRMETEDIVGEAKVMGVQALGDSGVVLRVMAECKPMTQFDVARKLRAMIKAEFDEKNIEIPYPRMVVYQRE